MDEQIIAIYGVCDDLLRAMHCQADPPCQMSDAEGMTATIVAALYLGANFEWARALLRQRQYMPTMLSRSRLNRRLHRLKSLFLTLFCLLAESWKELNKDSIYCMDTFPIAVCDNWRIKRAKIYHDEAFRGYIASKKRYFYGLKIHLMITEAGQPVEFFLTPGSFADVAGLPLFDFDLPEGSEV